MANKIQEIIVEPSKIIAGSAFKLKVKAIRYMTCLEMKTITCAAAKEFYCSQVKGED